MFKDTSICPVLINNGRSYILIEGDSLWNYFMAKQNSDLVCTEEELWSLLSQLFKALTALKQHGYTHHHIREYAIRRINEHTFKLIFHPQMNTIQSLVDKSLYHWYNFYLPPESLSTLEVAAPDAVVFSVGALLLNLMNPLDCKRDIYSSQAFELNQRVIA